MSRRTAVAVSLSLGLLLVPGVALASPWSSPWSSPAGPSGRGDVCDRGEPPCHTTTTRSTTTQPTTTTTGVSGTSATSTTTTTTQVSGTSATSTTTTAVSGTSATSSTTDPVTSATSTGPTAGQLTSTTAAVAPAGGRSVLGTASNERQALADTGATPALTALAGLATVLAGAVLLLFGRRRRGA